MHSRSKKILSFIFSLLFLGILTGIVFILIHHYQKKEPELMPTPPDRNIEDIRKSFRKFKSFSRYELSELTPPQLGTEDDPLIAEFELDRKKLKELKVPANWKLHTAALRRKSFPIRLEMKDKVISFDSSSKRGYYEIRTEPFLNYGAADYLMTITVSGKGKFRMGYCCYGQKATGESREIVVNSTIPATFVKSFNITENPDVQTFCFALSFIGKLKIHDLQVYVIPKTRPECSFVEGELVEVSPLPLPEQTDYPNCHFTAKLRVNGIFSGEPVPSEMQVVIPGFQQKKLLPSASLKKGDKVRVSLVPFEKATSGEKSIQQSDALEDFNLHSYFAFSIAKIHEFQKTYPGIPLLSETRDPASLEKPVNPPLSKELLEAKQQYIRMELERMNRFIKQAETCYPAINKKFSDIWARRAEKYNVLNPEEPADKQLIWANDSGHFFTLPRNFELVEKDVSMLPQNLQAIRGMKDFFERNGVRFIVQIIPDYYDIAARVLNPEFTDFPDIAAAKVTRAFLENGIETLYCSDLMVQKAHNYPLLFFYPKNSHPDTGAQEIMTDQLCQFIRKNSIGLTPLPDGNVFSVKEEETCYKTLESWPKNVDTGKYKGGSPQTGASVYLNDRKIEFDSKSPLLIFNSFIQTPMGEGAYPAYLARKLNHVPDHISISAMGPFLTIPKMFFANRQKYLAGKKLAVFPAGLKHLLFRNNFLNLQDMMELNTKLSGKSLSRSIPLPSAKPLSPDIMKKAAETLKYPDVKIAAWDDFITQSNASQYLIDPGKEQALCDEKNIVRLEANRTKPFVVLVKVAAFYEKNIVLTVNGIRKFVPTIFEAPCWNFMAFELPPETKNLHITLTSSDPNAIAAIQNMALHGL